MCDMEKQTLTFIDNIIDSCVLCELYKNGRMKPYWTENSVYILIGSHPGNFKNDDILWSIMGEYGFKKEQFLIINAVNCYGKPKNSLKTSKVCDAYLRSYIKAVNPLKGIIFGKISSEIILETDHVNYDNGLSFIKTNNFNRPLLPLVRLTPPSFLSFDSTGKYKTMFKDGIKKFKML